MPRTAKLTTIRLRLKKPIYMRSFSTVGGLSLAIGGRSGFFSVAFRVCVFRGGFRVVWGLGLFLQCCLCFSRWAALELASTLDFVSSHSRREHRHCKRGLPSLTRSVNVPSCSYSRRRHKNSYLIHRSVLLHEIVSENVPPAKSMFVTPDCQMDHRGRKSEYGLEKVFAVFLANEVQKGTASKWHALLQSLPSLDDLVTSGHPALSWMGTKEEMG